MLFLNQSAKVLNKNQEAEENDVHQHPREITGTPLDSQDIQTAIVMAKMKDADLSGKF